MKSISTLIFLFIISSGIILAQKLNTQKLYDSYSIYKEPDFSSKLFGHNALVEKIENVKNKKIINIEVAGKSLEGREIYLLSIGKGKTNVLLWSQMHGDESTATMALFDVFNFFQSNDKFNPLRDEILNNLKIYFIPMLNPDGAEAVTRRNALNIDLNRDALRLQFPESQILKTVRDTLDAKFAFNLHDQNTRYTSGNSYKSATISFLAPAFNYEKEVNEVRANTMKIIVDIYNELSKFIPGHIAKYKDDFEPRAFGDNFIKWGTSSVLIESGGWKNDEEKQFIRKLNFVSILLGLHSIATKSFENADINIYNKIPFNDNLLFDLLLRNLAYKYEDKYYTLDVGINREEVLTKDKSQNYYVGKIEDWGDLSVFYGYDELDLSGYEIRESKIFDLELYKLNEVDFNKLLREGYGFVRVDSLTIDREYSSLPLNVILKGTSVNLTPKYNGYANFTIWKNNELKFNIVNGFLYDLNSEIVAKNGLIFK